MLTSLFPFCSFAYGFVHRRRNHVRYELTQGSKSANERINSLQIVFLNRVAQKVFNIHQRS